VVAGWNLNGEDVVLEVNFLATIQDGSVTGLATTVSLEGPSTRQDLPSLRPEMDMTRCPVDDLGFAHWES
jgi:hypothetical protein